MGHLEATLETLLAEGVRDAVFPGAVAEVWRDGRRLASFSAGRTRRDGVDERVVDVDTVYDVASLTKVFVVTATWKLVARGDVDLGAPVAAWRPVASEDITVADLLRHTSGLPAWRPFFETAPHRREAIVEAAAAEPLERPPGGAAVYSDLGFMLLADLLERASGRPLADVIRDEVTAPLGLGVARYLPVANGPVLEIDGRAVAATEACPWRERVLCGEVHDDNCWAMGGVSGHAGLFATAAEVARLGAEWLLCRRGEGALLDRDAALGATTVTAGGRTTGFDVPSAEGSSAGGLLSRSSFGHLGFTGCSLWCDPDRDLVVVLLSNRVHPSRDNLRIRELRPRFHDAVVGSLG